MWTYYHFMYSVLTSHILASTRKDYTNVISNFAGVFSELLATIMSPRRFAPFSQSTDAEICTRYCGEVGCNGMLFQRISRGEPCLELKFS